MIFVISFPYKVYMQRNTINKKIYLLTYVNLLYVNI